MVKTRRGVAPAAETSKNEYERKRDNNVAEIRRRFEELGLPNLTASVKSFANESATSSKIRAGKWGRCAQGKDDSESDYLPEAQGDTDDDASSSSLDDEPVPLMAIEPRKLVTKKISSRRLKRTEDMPPGGARQGKRVRCTPPNETPAEDLPPGGAKQARTVSFALPNSSERPPGVTTRSSTRQPPPENSAQDQQATRQQPIQKSAQAQQATRQQTIQASAQNQQATRQQPIPASAQDQQEEDGVHSPRSHDWSYQGDYDNDDLVGEEEEHHEEQAQTGREEPPQRAPRKPRPPTQGVLLDRMTRSMQRRLLISVAEGYKRPSAPVQAAKFASEAGVIVRDRVPILNHWKDYKLDANAPIFKDFIGKLGARLAIDEKHKPTEEACYSVFQSGIRQQRYKLKQKYFIGIPADQIRTTTPVPFMTDVQWNQLVEKWSNPKNMQTSQKNKQNRANVKFHQATGSRSYVAQLHAYTEKKKAAARAHRVAADGLEDNADAPDEELEGGPDDELDVVEVFKECHTSRKKGLTDIVKEAIANMEALKAQAPAEGNAVSSAQVVSKVLPQNSSNIFLKNIGMQPTSPIKSATAKERALQEELAAERQSKVALQDEVNVLKQKSQETDQALERTQREMQEYKKAMDENNLLLRRFLMLSSENGGQGPSNARSPA